MSDKNITFALHWLYIFFRLLLWYDKDRSGSIMSELGIKNPWQELRVALTLCVTEKYLATGTWPEATEMPGKAI